MNIKTRLLLGLIVLGLFDIVIPIPIIGLILISVVLQQPPWFINIVEQLYKVK